MSSKKFSTTDRIKSVSYAFQGLVTFFKTQHNAWIHALAAVVAIGAGFWFGISAHEWCWIAMCIVMVFVAEMFNTAIEFLCDKVSPEIHPEIKKVKDVAAAAVLIAAIGAVVIGGIVFLPHFYH